MTTPVLVIHGVAHRDQGEFTRQVGALAAAVGGDVRLIPVFWGDLGGPMPGILDTIPEFLGTRDATGLPGGRGTLQGEIAAALLEVGSAPTRRRAGSRAAAAGRPTRPARSSRARRTIVADAAAAELAGGARPFAAGKSIRRGAAESRAASQAALREAIEAAWARATWLPLVGDETTLAAIGQAIGRAAGAAAAPPVGPATDGGAAELSSLRRGIDLGSLVGDLLGGFDRVIGSLVGGIGGAVNELLRERILPATVNGIGDVLWYQHHRPEVFGRVRDVIQAEAPGFGTRDQPIVVAGHSLGGIIAFDIAVNEPPLWIRHLVTFGSQSPALHVFDPRAPGLDVYAPGRPVRLPASIGAWTNVWEPLDPLAFIAHKVFVLGPGAPRDLMAAHRAAGGLWTHGDYWTHPALAEAIRGAAAG